LLAASPAPKPAASKTASPAPAKTSAPATPAPKSAGLQPAAPKPAKTLAPETLAHANAIFLNTLSKNGERSIQLRTAAINTHFFLEEAAGVSVYEYDGKSGYKRVEFMKGAKLAAAEKKYK
jgi:ABC-type uncharacterized transport system involved in gliding motility auxiliary subunit